MGEPTKTSTAQESNEQVRPPLWWAIYMNSVARRLTELAKRKATEN